MVEILYLMSIKILHSNAKQTIFFLIQILDFRFSFQSLDFRYTQENMKYFNKTVKKRLPKHSNNFNFLVAIIAEVYTKYKLL